MKREWKNIFLIGMLFLFAAEAAAVLLFAFCGTDDSQDSVLVNEAVQEVQADWEHIKEHKTRQTLLTPCWIWRGRCCSERNRDLVKASIWL